MFIRVFTSGYKCYNYKHAYNKIQPLYEKLAAEKNAALKFVLVDVDDLDEIAAAYDVAILPTFVAVQPTAAGTTTATVPETYAGSDPKKLKDFCMKISTAAKKNSSYVITTGNAGDSGCN